MKTTSAATSSVTPHGSMKTFLLSPRHRYADCWYHVNRSSISASFSETPIVCCTSMDTRESELAPARSGFRAAASLLRRNPDFRALYLAQLISFGGDWFLLVALYVLVLRLTNSP